MNQLNVNCVMAKIKKQRREKKEQKIIEVQTEDKQTITDKLLKDYKIFVFDLDYTLYLHSPDKYSEEYHVKVKNFLLYLKDNNKLLYVATHNKAPEYYLDKMNITTLFNGIIKETKNVSPCRNNIDEYTSKKDMIIEILNDNKNMNLDDVIFFDDHIYNIQQVNSIGVKSIFVNPLLGIKFSDIY